MGFKVGGTFFSKKPFLVKIILDMGEKKKCQNIVGVELLFGLKIFKETGYTW